VIINSCLVDMSIHIVGIDFFRAIYGKNIRYL